jgi:hypothetical protein
VTGFPYLDALKSFDVEAEGSTARRMLGLDPGVPLVLFAGQGLGTAAVLRELVEVLRGRDCYLMPRPHPRTKDNFAADMQRWQETLADYRGSLVVDWFTQCSPRQLIAAAALNGVVVSMFSTMLVEAAALHVPAVSVLYPEQGAALMRQEIPGLLEFPLVEAGSVAVARDRQSLKRVMSLALNRELPLEGFQKKQFPLDGQNAHRAAQLILGLL